MKLGNKLLLAPALTALIMLAVAQVDAHFMYGSAENTQAGFAKQIEQFKTINTVQDQVANIHTGVYRTMAIVGSLDDAKLKAVRTELAQQLQGVERVLGTISTDGVDASGIDKSRELTRQYQKQADSALDLASVDPNTGVAALQSADSTFQMLSQHLVGLVKKVDEHHVSQTEANRQTTARTHGLLVAFSVAAALVAIWASWLALRRVVAVLTHASVVAQEVASGNLDVSVTTQRKDELGDLLRALGAMQASLNKVVHEIRSSSDHIGVSSAQIASGTQDLASRTEAASSNLAQTASSMEELTATVRQSAEAARQANQLASTAADVAQRGGQVVSQVVSTMEDINQSSRKIADIIGVIDSIAFQTNILALNAAVEAARAGEAGRGFAVVASEVRSLAGRSAQAAKEIKDLINASVDKVHSGTQQVQDAGNTMTEIVASVQRVTDVIGEITAAASEQSDGIAQVNGAVNQLDQMTQQNAALVEQSTAAAESLKDQAHRLSDTVSVFKIRGAEPQVSTPTRNQAPFKVPSPASKASPRAALIQAPAPENKDKQIAPKPTTTSARGIKIIQNEAKPVAAATPAKPTAPTAQRASAPRAPAAAKAASSVSRVAKAPSSDNGDWESF